MTLGYNLHITEPIKELISLINKQEKKLNDLRVSKTLFEKMFQRNYLNQAYSSTKIEYSIINYNTAQKVLHKKKAMKEEEKELLNVANTQLILNNKLKDNLSHKLIIEAHTLVSKGLKGSRTEPEYKPGQYRIIQNYLGDPFSNEVSYTFPPPKEVKTRMPQLIRFINNNKKLAKLILPGVFHCIFIEIHPFINGNGRTVRLLEDFLLKKYRYNTKGLYNLSQYYYKNLKQYHFFLRTSWTQKDLTYFVEFYLEGVLDSIKDVFVEKKEIEKFINLHNLPEWKKMDKYDKKILSYIIKKDEITIKKGVKLSSKNLSPEAIRLRFQKYIKLGLITKTGAARDTKYIWTK